MKRLVLVAGIVGCVPSPAELRTPVDAELAHRLGAIDRDPTLVATLLAKPLDADSAVKIALANNARLAAAFDDLGVAGSELALALGPTHVDGQVRWGSAGREYELEVIQNVLGLIEVSKRRAVAHTDLAAARTMATATVLRLAARVEIEFHDLIAAEQDVELRHTAFDAADAAATIRERMHAAGNTSDLALARDRDAREQARVDLARAEAAVGARREHVNALLGVSGEQTEWTTSAALSALPDATPPLDDLEAAAVAASLDLAGGHARARAAEDRLGVEQLHAFLPELGLGVSIIDQAGAAAVGPAVRLGIPLFDQRSGDRARARAAVARANHELTAVAIELRAGARAARVTALAAYAEARRLRDVVLPLRQQIVDQTLLHYNAMDADPFQLIVARRELADAAHQYLDAVRRYTNAMTEVTALRRGVQLDPPSSR